MNYKEQLQKDLEYVYSECGEVALYKDSEILILDADEYEVEGAVDKVIRCIASDVPTLKKSDIFTIESITYKCLVFSGPKEGEMIIGLTK